MHTTIAGARRTVRYSTLTEVVRDAEQLLDHHYTVGNWSYGQIAQHLAKTMHASVDEFEFQSPLILRWIFSPFKHSSLKNKKPAPPGMQTHRSLLPDEHIASEEGLQQLKIAVDRQIRETSFAPSPLFGTMTKNEWLHVHLQHCELHMSFILSGSGDEPVRCPKCGSIQIHAEKRGWSLSTGLVGSGKILITCLKRGNKFEPGMSKQ